MNESINLLKKKNKLYFPFMGHTCDTHYSDIGAEFLSNYVTQEFLKLKNCNFLWNGSLDVPIDINDEYRFDGEYKDFLDLGADGGHPGPKHNESYSKNLYNHINNNFPHFISDNDYKNVEKNII
jgi:hypothetical protein